MPDRFGRERGELRQENCLRRTCDRPPRDKGETQPREGRPRESDDPKGRDVMISVKNNFDSTFWINQLKNLNYPLDPIEMDIPTLKDSKVIPSDLFPSKILKLTSNDFVEIAILEFDQDSSLTRSKCTKTTRSWKSNRLIKPLLIFTNGTESFLVMVPGKGVSGEAKILSISEKLYHTDQEVLESIRYPGTAETLNENYDATFFPYMKVRTEFFEGYSKLYQKIVAAVEKFLGDSSPAYAQRFLGRIMFLYFLQRKGWLQNDRHFIDGIEDYRELNILFYESLNTGNTPGIPFLNGSLFEREEYLDSSMENKLYPGINALFKESRSFFNQYNFTVDESSPLDVEVSIDPVLIGTVFENMLPEHERGAKGTFYTHRNEISFICRRALSNWLDSPDQIVVKSDGKEEFKDGLNLLVERVTTDKREIEVRELREKLLSARVLDPAVGSGGFLLVMMQEMVALIHEIEAVVGWKSDPKELKIKILRNLYGFDIEPEAVEIARLRLWLSLIIDQKDPEALPNLDMNIVKINDSLIESSASKPRTQLLLNHHQSPLRIRDELKEISMKYISEHDPHEKKRLTDMHRKLSEEFRKETGLDTEVIEAYMHGLADIVIMNPPYIRGGSIPLAEKEYYVSNYRLDKNSDIYAYFLVRSHHLLASGGIASVISSDKWLETGYGLSLQREFKDYIICVYGQKERSFEADINTVVTVFSKERRGNDPVRFTYVEKYGEAEIRRSVILDRKSLKPGNWFYLRVPKIFIEKILPKLTHKLRDFTNIKRGFTTGSNDFFYLINISHLLNADFLNKHHIYEDKIIQNLDDAKKNNLIYVVNEMGKRFLINKKDVYPVIRSPSDITSYIVNEVNTLVFKPNVANTPGKYSLKYIKWGENYDIKIKSGREKGKIIKGYHKLKTVINRKPNWYNLSNLEESILFHAIGTNKRHFVAKSSIPYYADQMLVMINSKEEKFTNTIWLYLNSTISFIIFELFGRRFGAGALQVPTGVMKNLPVPNITELKYGKDIIKTLERKIGTVEEEISFEKRRLLDIETLNLLEFEDSEVIINELYNGFMEIVNDRLIKSGKGK